MQWDLTTQNTKWKHLSFPIYWGHIAINVSLFQIIIYQNNKEITPIHLNKHETDPYFLQIFQSNTSACLIISMFCKSCEPICESEITPVLYHLRIKTKTISRAVFSSQILQNAEINIDVNWKFWRKFSCTKIDYWWWKIPYLTVHCIEAEKSSIAHKKKVCSSIYRSLSVL